MSTAPSHDQPPLSRLGAAAVGYAKMGWRVFPLKRKDKRPFDLCWDCLLKLPAADKETGARTCKGCGTIVEKSHGGLHLAESDPARVEAVWRKFPDCNIGLRCGDGRMVLDVDVPDPDDGKTDDGEASLADLEVRHGVLPPTAWQMTGLYAGRRGRQYIFAVDIEIRNSAGKLGPGLDVRGDGGYIAAAPSVHPSGVEYKWGDNAKPSQFHKTGYPPAPAWLLDLLKPKISEQASAGLQVERPTIDGINVAYIRAAIDGEYEAVANAPKGRRNETINNAAFTLGRLVGGGYLTEAEAKQTILAGADKCGELKDDKQKTIDTIERALADGMKQPRAITTRERAERVGGARLRLVQSEEPPPHGDDGRGGGGGPTEPPGGPPEPPDEPPDYSQKYRWLISDWKQRVVFKAETNLLDRKSIQNAITLLLYRSDLADLFLRNKRSRRIVVTRHPPWTKNGVPYPRLFADSDITGLQAYLEKEGPISVGKQSIHDAIEFAASEREFDPVLEQLNSFVWDGTERLDHWLIDYMGVEDTSFSRQAGAKWLIAGCARILKPGVKVDTVLVLEGEQGIKKSMAFEVLAEALDPDCFLDRLSSLKDKDSAIELVGKVIVELAELSALKGQRVEEVKSFLSRRIDDLRLPWDKTTSRLPRGCIFGGTVNNDGTGWLSDPTGNRRFWPVTTTKIDIEELREVAPQLWAEARARHAAGEAWWLTDTAVEELARLEALARMSEDPWAHRIDKWLKGQTSVRIDEVMDELGIPTIKQGDGEQKRIAAHLRKRGWRRTRPRGDGGSRPPTWIPPRGSTLLERMDDVDG